MGYYTNFEMAMVTDKANAIGDFGFRIYDMENLIEEEILVKELMEISGLEMWEGYEPTFHNLLCEEMKWYEHRCDMINLSKRHPELYFRLSGQGEELDDIWEEVYHNGKAVQKYAEIIYPTWDETDLED